MTEALLAPIPITTFGLAAFGLAHVVFELRYVIGRFRGTVDALLATVLALVLSLIALSRVAAALFPTAGQALEIGLGMAVLAVGAWIAGQRRLGLAAVAVATVAAFVWPQWYFHVLTHIHNLIPLLFLWDWARRRLPTSRAVAAFMGVNLIWAVFIPVAIVGGAFDALISTDPGPAASWVGDGARVLAASAPPGADPLVAARFLAAFAFLQSMHYVVWMGFFPLFGREEGRQFDLAVPALRGWRAPALAVVAGAILLAIFFTSYAAGRTIYSILASYHVYVEFPLLLLLAAGASRGVRAVT
ncbi:MAG: hypothetical protein Q4G35_00030 [Propionibacteriaceae bacterium]|nr:hypothetical protein [Propionibacteriaceae bacterium]